VYSGADGKVFVPLQSVLPNTQYTLTFTWAPSGGGIITRLAYRTKNASNQFVEAGGQSGVAQFTFTTPADVTAFELVFWGVNGPHYGSYTNIAIARA
jgi:hypothetical protein